jgi:hypothetical protein
MLPENRDKKVIVKFNSNDSIITLKISDEGGGFKNNLFDKININNISNPTGKGIIFSKGAFEQLIYNEKGNEVTCINKSS